MLVACLNISWRQCWSIKRRLAAFGILHWPWMYCWTLVIWSSLMRIARSFTCTRKIHLETQRIPVPSTDFMWTCGCGKGVTQKHLKITFLKKTSCLRCARNNINETAQYWFEKIHQIFVLQPQDGMVNILTAIRFMEGLTLQLHVAMIYKNIGAMIFCENEVRSLIKSISAAIKVSKTFEARLVPYNRIHSIRN